MINPHQFVGLILEPALKATDTYSLDAIYLVARTLVMESKLTHLKQLPEGPGLGFGQIEWATYLDCCRYLKENHRLREDILRYTERQYLPETPVNLMGDLSLNVLICRVKYYMIHEPIPSYKDVMSQANYYKKYYNTSEGAATLEMFERSAVDLQGWIDHGNES